jgi:hypothetical protein
MRAHSDFLWEGESISEAKLWSKIPEKTKIGPGGIFSDLLTREMKKGLSF